MNKKGEIYDLHEEIFNNGPLLKLTHEECEQLAAFLVEIGYRKASDVALEVLDEFQAIYNSKAPERQKQKRLISADDLIAYCKKCGDVVQGMADEIITKIGHGESEISALGGCAFFLQQARIYKFDLPNAIECFIKENENERQAD